MWNVIYWVNSFDGVYGTDQTTESMLSITVKLNETLFLTRSNKNFLNFVILFIINVHIKLKVTNLKVKYKNLGKKKFWKRTHTIHLCLLTQKRKTMEQTNTNTSPWKSKTVTLFLFHHFSSHLPPYTQKSQRRTFGKLFVQ